MNPIKKALRSTLKVSGILKNSAGGAYVLELVQFTIIVINNAKKKINFFIFLCI